MQVDLINAMRLVDQRADLELAAKGQIAGQQLLESKVRAARVYFRNNDCLVPSGKRNFK